MPEPVKEEKVEEKDWKKIAEEAIATRDAAKQKNRQVEEELTKYRQTEAERATREAQSREEQERAKLAEQGKYQEAVKLVETKYQGEIQNIYSKITETFVPAAIKSAASKMKNITPEALQDLPSLIGGKIKLNPKTFEAFVANEKGEPLTDEKLNPVPLESFVESFVKARSYMLVDGMPKGTGAGPITTTGKAYTIENALTDPKLDKEWQKADPTGHARALEDFMKDAPRRARERLNSGTKHSVI